MNEAPNIAAEVLLKWGDGDYMFALKLKQIDELQRLCDQPLGVIVQRVIDGRPSIAEIRETIRLGLIGGGTAPVRARELVETYVDGQPLANPRDPSCPLLTAQSVLGAVWFGVTTVMREAGEEPQEGKNMTGMEGSTSPPTTDRDLLSDLVPKQSVDTASLNGSHPDSSMID